MNHSRLKSSTLTFSQAFYHVGPIRMVNKRMVSRNSRLAVNGKARGNF